MSGTVIDSLVVLLGLDVSGYKKGRVQAEKETSETARKVKQSTTDITKALADVGRTVASLFLGFESVSGFGKFLGGLNANEAALGRTATALGINVHELNRYGLAARLAGQSSDDVASAFQTLTSGALQFLSGRGSSPIMDLLRMAGVSAVDATGKLRNQGEVYEELAQKTSKWGAQIQAQRFREAGIAEGEIQFLIQAQALRQKQYSDAEKNNSVTADSVRQAQELQAYWRGVGMQVEQFGQVILTKITPYLEAAFEWAKELIGTFKDSGGLNTVANIFGTIANTVKSIFNGWHLILDYLNNNPAFKAWDKYVGWFTGLFGKAVAAGADPGAATKASAAVSAFIAPPNPNSLAARNNNPGNIKDRATGQFKKYATLEEGQAAMAADLRAKYNRGLRTVAAIISAYEGTDTLLHPIETSNYIKSVSKQLGKEAGDQLTPQDLVALQNAMTRFESGPTPGALGKSSSGAAASAGSTTTVTIDAINVNAPNADPRAVADNVAGAIQRKVTVAQAAQGQS